MLSLHSQLLDKFYVLINLCEEKNEASRSAYMHNRIDETLDNGKNFWREVRNLGLIPKASEALHGFMPDELNDYFLSIAISPHEDSAE